MDVHTRPLMTLRLRVAPQIVGRTPIGDRRIVPVLDGHFEGERLRGAVEPGGSDWILVRPDGAFQLDVRLALRTDDDRLIGMPIAASATVRPPYSVNRGERKAS